MTFERKIVVGLGDIKAVSFQCDSCAYRVTMAPEEVRTVPASCPQGHEWRRGTDQISQREPVLKFSEALGVLRTLIGNKTLGFHILLEFDEPQDRTAERPAQK